jgi:hypothetical protein
MASARIGDFSRQIVREIEKAVVGKREADERRPIKIL